MKRILSSLATGLGLLALLGSAPSAQSQEKKAPATQMIAIYQIAPGKHLDFLKWMAAQEVAGKEAGAAASMWYAHKSGASWDYISIKPELDPARAAELDKKTDALAKQKGLATGFKASLEFRQFVSNHSDTSAMGPMSVDELVKAARD